MSRFIPAYYYDQLIKDPTNPLLNHAVGDVLPVGSVFKLVTGTGALNEGVVTPDQMIETPPKLEVTEKYYANDPGKSREFVDWNKAGFGHLDFVHGLANSSNVYFYKLGGGYKDEVPVGLGICRLKTYAEALGYGDAPGLGLPDEQNGLLPDPAGSASINRKVGPRATLIFPVSVKAMSWPLRCRCFFPRRLSLTTENTCSQL